MKKLLVPTDFSAPAENAANYAVSLACTLEADIVLCHAIPSQEAAPTPSQLAWPMLNEQQLRDETEGSLIAAVNQLLESGCHNQKTYCPKISFHYDEGKVADVIEKFVKELVPDLVVMGLTGASHLVQLALGSNSKRMIDVASRPVLYIPFSSSFVPYRKIIFASDLQSDNLDALKHLVSIASPFGAEILVYHVSNYKTRALEEQHQLDRDFQDGVIAKLEYKHVKYYSVWHDNVDSALEWMRNQDGVDLLAMVHRRHNLMGMLLHGSHTQRSSRLSPIPLLVYQASNK